MRRQSVRPSTIKADVICLDFRRFSTAIAIVFSPNSRFTEISWSAHAAGQTASIRRDAKSVVLPSADSAIDVPMSNLVVLDFDGIHTADEVLNKLRSLQKEQLIDLEAVLSFVDYKYAPGHGTFRDGGAATAWRDGKTVQSGIPRYSDEAIAATIAYCKYIHERYGRFPINGGPFRTLLAYQAHRLDPDFYGKFYKEGALPETVADGD